MSLGVKKHLKISKGMRQSLQILQMPTQDLKDYLNQELQANPFIEMQSEVEIEGIDTSPNSEEERDRKEDNFDCELGKNDPREGEDFVYDSYKEQESYLRYDKFLSYKESDINEVECEKIPLKEYLIEQISIEIKDNKEKIMAFYLTDLLDENGYLVESMEKITQTLRCSEDFVYGVLKKLYKLDPTGIYAFGLKDCIKIQLRECSLFDSRMEKLVDNLELIARGDVRQLIKLCDTTPEEIIKMIEIVKGVDPKPGRNFSREQVRTLIPDVYIYMDKLSNLNVTLNTAALPKLLVNDEYFKKSAHALKSQQEKNYCDERLKNANWIAKAMRQRAQTIYKAAKQLAEEQYEFFEKGVNYLKPMNLSDIATKIGVHESTISRISNKVIECKMGVFEFKYFFNNALSSNISENMVATIVIKNKIKNMIANENVQSVLADDAIAQTLQECGISISRRTVAKYRDLMQIPTSGERKRRLRVQY